MSEGSAEQFEGERRPTNHLEIVSSFEASLVSRAVPRGVPGKIRLRVEDFVASVTLGV